MHQKRMWRVIPCGAFVLLLGCVTETERMPYRRYYDPQQDESVLDELKREFGWRKNAQGKIEAPYTRAARGVKETVAGWFSDEGETPGTPGWQKSFRNLKQEQAEAIRRAQERQEQGIIEQRTLGGAQRAEGGN
jgi:hypothetical protein